MARAFVSDFPDFDRAEFEDEDTFRFSDGARAERIGPQRYVFGTGGDDIAYGDERWSNLHGGGGSDLLRAGSGGGRLDGGNDGFAGDLLFGPPRGTPGGERIELIMDGGPDDYLNALGGGKTLYIAHKAGPTGYYDAEGRPHPMFIKNFDARNGSLLDFSDGAEVTRVVWGEIERNRDGSAEREVLGVHLRGDNDELVFLRFDPLEPDVMVESDDGGMAGFRDDLGDLLNGGEWNGDRGWDGLIV